MSNISTVQELLKALPPHLLERVTVGCPGARTRPGRYVVYWTHHALRVDENPALDVARHLSHTLKVPLLVYQGLSETYRFASDRHHTFILEAAIDLASRYRELGLTYCLHVDRPQNRKHRLAKLAFNAAALVTEDFPIEATHHWTRSFAKHNSVPVVLVDTACVVPMRVVGKAYDRAFEYRRATERLYRERISKPWPAVDLEVQSALAPFESLSLTAQLIPDIVARCEIDHSIGPVTDTRGGSTAGYARWDAFRRSGLGAYEKRRNQIELDGASRMSAYLHYGMVSPFRLAREAAQDKADKYLDELLIWRELAYCFCRFRDQLETAESLPAWAVATLQQHVRDQRQVLSWEKLARAQSGNALWNAAQRSLLKHGELHNNVRMTWGKAIVEWSSDWEQALRRLIDLNHRFALDGRDPASYGGLLWCLGQFDRPFFPEQPVFGSVRTRPLAVHESRTNVDAYKRKVDRPLFEHSPKIAMIGAGLGGLMCSRILTDHGLQVTCFDKSHRPGGRSATRVVRDHLSLAFDHGAQYFTCKDQRLQPFVDSWCQDGHIARWNGKVVAFDRPSQWRECEPVPRYVGTPHMESLARHLSEDLRIEVDREVAQVVRTQQGYELLSGQAQSLGTFDIVLWNCPPKQVSAMVPQNCGWVSQLDSAVMDPCWAVMLALKEPWSVPWDGAFVNCGNLSWLCRNSSKPSRFAKMDTWVLHSTSSWAANHLELAKEEVVSKLIADAECTASSRMPEYEYAAAHRWLYARPQQPLEDCALWDGSNGLGACGDWCGSARIEGALLSGVALAGRVLGDLHAKTPNIPGSSAKVVQLSLL